MAWHAYDSGQDCERVLVLPRQQPADDGELERWLQQARRIARVVHPHLAPVLEVGAQERWPYVAHDTAHAATFAARPPAAGGEAPADRAGSCVPVAVAITLASLSRSRPARRASWRRCV